MNLLTPFTPFLRRVEQPQGTDASHSSYTASNQPLSEQISPQDAPDPIRQGRTPARPSRQYIALMGLRPADWNIGFPDDNIPYNRHWIPMREMLTGRQNYTFAQNEFGVRPNITKPAAYTYGSLFSLGYDEAQV